VKCLPDISQEMQMAIVLYMDLGCKGLRRAMVNGLHLSYIGTRLETSMDIIVMHAVHRSKLESNLNPVFCLPPQWKLDV